MCGRYALFRWSQDFAALPGFPSDQRPHWSLAPGASVLLLRRAETLAEQPMFREAFRLRRGLLPANGFYEWRGSARKRPYWMTCDGSLAYFAALWEAYPVQGHTYLSAAVVTQPAATLRRPLILDEAGQAAWLDPATPLETLQQLLLQPSPALRERPLATLVNDPRLDSPECLTPA